jgi:Fe-S cluster biogenesis protein NfuA
VGLETANDLIEDLEISLEAARSVEPVATSAVAARSVAVPGIPGLMSKITVLVDEIVAPAIIARGGAVRVVSVDEGVVTLEADGSPGAIVPTVARIEAILRNALPEIREVRVRWPGESPSSDDAGDLVRRIQGVLDAKVNRAVAAHGGRVTIVDAANGNVRLRLEGGCQGCSLAEVTLRQGIEPLLRRHVPDLVAVIDATDHSAGTAPFYAPGKR